MGKPSKGTPRDRRLKANRGGRRGGGVRRGIRRIVGKKAR